METCQVLTEIINEKKLPTLFIGSGISKRYISTYPNWDGLLRLMADKIGISEDRYYNIITQVQEEIHSDVPYEVNPIIADKLALELGKKIDSGELQYKDIFTNEQRNKMLKYKYSPFKYLLTTFFNNIIPDKSLDELKYFKELKNSISTVVTTNYDKFIEEIVFENTFDVLCNQKSYYNNKSQGIGEIYKIHGTVLDPNSIIINSNDYLKFKEKSKLVTAKLLSLLCDSPFIFMGYSLNDNDINSILGDFVSCVAVEDLNLLSKNLIFIEYKKGEEKLIQGNHSVQNAQGDIIPFSKITTDNYGDIYQHLLTLKPCLKPYEVRKLKESIRKIILQNNAGEKRILATDVDTFSNINSSNAYAIYFGQKSEVETTIKPVGLFGIRLETILLDALFESTIEENRINPHEIFNPQIQSKARQHIPFYYYIRKGDIRIDNLPPEVRSLIESTYANLLSKNNLKMLAHVPKYSSIQELDSAISQEMNNGKIANLLMKNISFFASGSQLKDKLKEVYINRPEIINSTMFRKLILLCDVPNFIDTIAKIG